MHKASFPTGILRSSGHGAPKVSKGLRDFRRCFRQHTYRPRARATRLGAQLRSRQPVNPRQPAATWDTGRRHLVQPLFQVRPGPRAVELIKVRRPTSACPPSGAGSHDQVRDNPSRGKLPGRDRSNICNRGRQGMGVQLELPRSLRDRLETDDNLFNGFVKALRCAINHILLAHE